MGFAAHARSAGRHDASISILYSLQEGPIVNGILICQKIEKTICGTVHVNRYAKTNQG